MAKTACEQEAEYLELRGHPHSARADALRAEGRELKRLRKGDYEKLLKAWIYHWQQMAPNMKRANAIRCIALVVDEYEREAARIQKNHAK